MRFPFLNAAAIVLRPALLSGLLALGAAGTARAQGVGIGTPSADASAALDVQSTTQGMLVPRMAASQRTAIATPAAGLLVYQTDAPAGFYFYNGSAWTSLSGGPALPSQAGNAGKVLTTDGTNLSWAGGYSRETLTVLRLPEDNSALNYVVPAFVNGVTTQYVVFTGNFNSNSSVHSVTFPDPATVPDGSRIVMKRMGSAEANPQTNFVARYVNWPVTSGIDGSFAIGSVPTSGISIINSGTGVTNRFAITYMKITHRVLNNNLNSNTVVYSDWVPIAGWREQP